MGLYQSIKKKTGQTARIALVTLFAASASLMPATTSAASAQQSTSVTQLHTIDESAHKHTVGVHLAYVKTSNERLNEDALLGLEFLSAALSYRTNIDAKEVVGVDIESDDIALLPFIYWPVSQDSNTLALVAQKKVQSYINRGGMIVFDLHGLDGSISPADVLQSVLGGVRLKKLEEMNEEHTLSRTFYKLETLRGTYRYDEVFVEKRGEKGTESVSSVIISENNWAAAWSGKTLPTGSKEREMAYRAGINMVFYAFTGQYKTDQIDIRKTIDRLGR